MLCEAERVAMTTEQIRAYLTKQHFIITTHFMFKNGQKKKNFVYQFHTSLIIQFCCIFFSTEEYKSSHRHLTILAASSRRVRKWQDTLHWQSPLWAWMLFGRFTRQYAQYKVDYLVIRWDQGRTALLVFIPLDYPDPDHFHERLESLCGLYTCIMSQEPS